MLSPETHVTYAESTDERHVLPSPFECRPLHVTCRRRRRGDRG